MKIAMERISRKRRNTMARQNEIPAKWQKLDEAAQEEMLAYKQEVDEMDAIKTSKRIKTSKHQNASIVTGFQKFLHEKYPITNVYLKYLFFI